MAEASEKEARPRHVRTRLMGALRLFITRIPSPVGNFLADRLGDVVYHLAHKSRRAAISNMYHVLGPVPRPQLKRAVRGVFRNVMRNYYDLLRAPEMGDREIDRRVDFDEQGWQRIVELHKQGQGVLLVTAHFGGFDIITHVLSRRGVPVSFIIAQAKPAWLSDFVTEMRARRGLNLLLVEEEEESKTNLGVLKESITRLRRGEVLGVVADRNMEQQGAAISFFGHEAVVAMGVAKIALRTRSPVVTGFCQRLPKGKYKVTFDEPVQPEGSASNPEDVKALLSKVFANMERYIARNPEQWVLLQPVWKGRSMKEEA